MSRMHSLSTRVKPAPVRHTLVVFDATRYTPLTPNFAAGLDGTTAVPPSRRQRVKAKVAEIRSKFSTWTAADYRRVDRERARVYAEACRRMPEAEAVEVAGDAAVAMADRIDLEKQLASRDGYNDRADDSPAWDYEASVSECEDRLCLGLCC